MHTRCESKRTKPLKPTKMKERDNLILCAVGRQQVGKTTQTRKELLFQYVSGKKALIFTPGNLK